MYTYALTPNGLIARSDGLFIPADPHNTDYAAYLAWVTAGNTPAPSPSPSLAQLKSDLSDDVDNLVAAAYSNWSRFQAEYQAREEAAQAFKDLGYAGDPGIYVSGFATAAGLSNQAAANLILSQASALNGALAAIGAQRMRKYAIAAAADAAGAQAVHDDIVTQVNTLVAGIT